MIVGHKAIAMIARGAAVRVRILADLQLGGHGWTLSCVLDRKETRWWSVARECVEVTQSSNSSSSAVAIVIEVSAEWGWCHGSRRIQGCLHLQLWLKRRLRQLRLGLSNGIIGGNWILND